MQKIDIDLQTDSGRPLSPLLFGSFIEHIENCISGGVYAHGHPASDSAGVRQNVLQLAKELRPSALRFPGGTVIGIYHWEEHTGPIEQRIRKRNIVWGGMLEERFGTAEFAAYCQSLGAEPMLCVNMPTGTPEEAANWVEYCNGTGDGHYANLRRSHGYEAPFAVKYWCIGNESHAVPDLGNQHHVADYCSQAMEFIKYMKLTDPAIKIVLVGFDDAWNQAVLEKLGPVCDYLSIHFYAHADGKGGQFNQLSAFEDEVVRLQEQLDAVNAAPVEWNRWYRFPHRQGPIKLALDEWNIWNDSNADAGPYGLSQVYNWQDALWTACFLNMLIRHCDVIEIGCMAQLVNVIAPILADENGCHAQTTYYPVQQYVRFAGETGIICNSSTDGIDIAATGKNGKTTLFAVNKCKEETLLFLPFTATAATILTAPAPDAVCSRLENVVSAEERLLSKTREITLPGYGIAVIRE